LTQHFTYETALGATRFSRPRGVSIQPFVTLESPRFGDLVIGSSTVRFRWRDPAIDRFTVRVLDLGTATAPLSPPVGFTPISRSLTAEQRLRQSVAMNFQSLFGSGPRPVDGHRYRIEVTVITSGNQALSSTSIDVGFER
jgi:hypothetical protein